MMNFFRTVGTAKNTCAKLDTLEQRLGCLADAGPQAIDARLAELDQEWTAGRMTKATIGVLIVVGFALSALSSWWLILPIAGGLFLLPYLFTRSSWLGKTFHELGYRTGFEVDQEKMALKVLRGDFRYLPTVHDVESHDDVSRLEGEGGIAIDPDSAKVDPKDAAKVALDATRS